MEDEHSPSSSSSSSIPISMDNVEQEQDENFLDDPASEKTISITLSPGSSLVVAGEGNMKKPFRPVGRSSTSSTASASSRISKMKQSMQKSCATKERYIKCVLIGDSKVGKSTLVQTFLNGQSTIPPDYVPTLQDTHLYTGNDSMKVNDNEMENVDENENKNASEGTTEKKFTLQICDLGGQEDMDRLRPLCYSQAQMVIICFSVMNPTSFANVTMKWLPEVKRHCMVTEDPKNPLKLLLVGTQSDLRSNVNLLLKLMDDGLAPISETQALRLANKIGALKYVESSSITNNNVNHIFDLVMSYGKGKHPPKHVLGLPLETGLQEKILPNLTERKLLFWRRWKGRQSKSSNKMKRLVLLPCFF